MTENPPNLESIGAKRDFKTVTKTGNELIKAIQATHESEDHGQIIKEGLQSAIREYISIILEKAELSDKVGDDKRYDFLQEMDFQSIFEDRQAVEAVVTQKLHHLVEQSVKDQKSVLKKLDVLDRLDQVSNIKILNPTGQGFYDLILKSVKVVKRLEKRATKEQVKELREFAKPAHDFVHAYKEKLLR